VVEGFLVGGLGEVVAELGIELAMVGCGVGLDGFGNLLEGGEVGGGVAVAERVVGDDTEAALEEGLEFQVHGEIFKYEARNPNEEEDYGLRVAANL
jgi:hypothetical protein